MVKILILLLVLVGGPASAATISSSNYQIENGSVVGSVAPTLSSTNYSVQGTFAEPVASPNSAVQSGNYLHGAGFAQSLVSLSDSSGSDSGTSGGSGGAGGFIKLIRNTTGHTLESLLNVLSYLLANISLRPVWSNVVEYHRPLAITTGAGLTVSAEITAGPSARPGVVVPAATELVHASRRSLAFLVGLTLLFLIMFWWYLSRRYRKFKKL